MTGSGTSRRPRSAAGPADEACLILLGGFFLLLDGREAVLPSNAQRMLAGLCVGGRRHLPQPRSVLAERLWPESSSARAQASLRTALWRIRCADVGLVTTTPDHVRLNPAVKVDVHASLAQAERLLSDDELAVTDTQVEPLVLDLLPGWDDDWLLLERERVHQIHLHALESLSTRFRHGNQYGRAVEAAMAAISKEPLRESARIALIAAHLEQGNMVEAERQHRRYGQILWDEMRLLPAHSFADLMSLYAPADLAAFRAGSR